MSDAKEVSYGFGVKVAVLMLIIVQYTMTMTTQINTQIMNYSLSLGEQFGYLYNQTDAIIYSLALVSGLSTTFLLRKFTKKQVACGGAVLMGFFGFLPFLTGPSGYMGVLVPRALMGLGAGIIMPFAASYAVDLFKGGKESWMLGMRSVVGACAGYFFMNASYVIAVNYFPDTFPTGSFLLPLLAFACLLIMIWKLPKEKVLYSKETESEEESKKVRPAASGMIYASIALLMVGVVVALAYFVYQAVSNMPGSTPDPAVSYGMSVAIAVIFLLFAVVFVITIFRITAIKSPGEGIDTKIKSNTWIFILSNVLVIGACNCMMSMVAQVVGGMFVLPEDQMALFPEGIRFLGPWNIGNVMNAFTVAMLISGFIFKPVWSGIFKRYAYVVGIFMCGAGLLLLYFAVTAIAGTDATMEATLGAEMAGAMTGNFPLALIGAVLFGFGFQTYNGAVILRIAQSNDNKHVALSTSYLMAFNGVGQTFGPMWIPGLIMIVTGLAFSDMSLFSLSWLFAGCILIIMTVIMWIYTARESVYRPEAAF